MHRSIIMKRIVAALFCAVVFGAVMTPPSSAQKAMRDSIRVSEYPPYDTFLPGNIVKFGIQTGFIFTKNFDTGMDCGGRISQQFFHPYFKLTSQFHFWAASRKNIDIGVAGIEESITYQIPLLRRLFIYSGFTLGYISTLKEETVVEGTENKILKNRNNDFEPFVTVGIEYALDQNRSAFIENKLGSTALSKEIHFLIGLNFYRTEKPAGQIGSGKVK